MADAGLLETPAGGENGAQEAWRKVKEADGVIVPGGFGKRGHGGHDCCDEVCEGEESPVLGVCVWACRWLLWSLRGMCAVSPMQLLPNVGRSRVRR